MTALSLILLLICPAKASTGPWVLSAGDNSVYLGVESQRFDHLALSTGSGSEDVLQVSDGTQAFGAKAIATLGILQGIEAELLVPWQTVISNRESAFPCPDLGLSACKTTTGVGVIAARVKGLLLDEILGPPLSLALGTELRMGQLSSSTRQRITNVGEGTIDLGAFVSVGRIGSLRAGSGGGGFWSAMLESGARYRSHNHDFAQVTAPGGELWADSELLLSPRRRLSLGPAATWLWRPSGVDFEDLLADPALLADADRLSALRIMNLQAGAKLLVRTGSRLTTSVSLLRTVYAINNPSDVWTVDLGLSARGIFTKRSTPAE